MKRIVYIAFLSIILTGCLQDPCYTDSGSIIIERREIADSISTINLFDNLNLEIYIDSIQYVDVVAGSNLQEKILIQNSANELTIKNDNKCSQFRSFDQNLTIRLHVKSFSTLNYQGYGNIDMKDTLLINDFNLNAENGAGELDLKVISKNDFGISCIDTYSKIKLAGSCEKLSISYSGTAWFHAEYLNTKQAYIDHNGTGDCIVSISDHLTCLIKHIGNIKYFGNPKIEILNNSGKGSLISLK